MVRVSEPSLTNVQPGCGGVPGVEASSLNDVTASATVHPLLTVRPVAWAARAERKRAHTPAPIVTKRRVLRCLEGSLIARSPGRVHPLDGRRRGGNAFGVQ